MTSKPTRPVPGPPVPGSPVPGSPVPGSPVPGPPVPNPGAPSSSWPDGSVQRVGDGEATSAAFGYLGAIFLGPVIPLIIYLIVSRRSPFARHHAATAVNLSISCLLYVLCAAIFGSLLALNNVTIALVIGLSLVFVIWLTMLRYLIRGVIAANRGEQNEVPGWICARIVS
jgi:uncharacterized Tic20 family protein